MKVLVNIIFCFSIIIFCNSCTDPCEFTECQNGGVCVEGDCVCADGFYGVDCGCPSTCGVITDDGIDGDCYWLQIRNDCTNNYKTFCFDSDVWFDAYVGNDFCVSNVEPW
jgi:hypothetical protein